MPALDSLTSSLTVQLGFQASKNPVGSAYSPVSQGSTLKKSSSVGTAAANNAAGGGNELASFITTIAASGSAAIDLTALTDVLLQSGVSLARVKGILIRLLSAADDPTNGTAAAAVTVGNNGANDFVSQAANRGWLGSATSTLDIPNGGFVAFGAPNANGVLVDATHKVVKVANLDAGVAAAVETSFQGATT